jgi:ResB-like family
MSDTSVQTAPKTPSAAAPVAASVPKTKAQPWTLMRVLKLGASLRLTVILFVLSLLLVFFGTLAQIENGIWTVVADYFRSFYVWVPFQVFVKFGQVFFWVPETFTVSGSFPFFGGTSLGAMLLLNLLAAHAVRFKLSWKRAGILAIHAGLIVLMLGELGTGKLAVEQRMSIATGETVSFTDTSNRVELAFLTPDPADPHQDLVVVVPQRLLQQKGRITNAALPVDVEVKEFWKNSRRVIATDKKVHYPNERTTLGGLTFGIVNEKESSGVEIEAREDMPSARVVLYEKGTDDVIGEYFVSLWYYGNMHSRANEFEPKKVEVGTTTYLVELRPRREYKPYALTLKKFSHDVYQGTDTPKNFSSLVNLDTPSGEHREYTISMNNPLFHGGETMYQSSFFPGDRGTVLQVVRNPVWWMPYLSCFLVTVGMIVHFGVNLLSFLQRRAV